MTKMRPDLHHLAEQSVSTWLEMKVRTPVRHDVKFKDIGIDLPALQNLSRFVETQFQAAGVTIDLPPHFVQQFTHGTVHSFINALPGQSTTGSSGPILPPRK